MHLEMPPPSFWAKGAGKGLTNPQGQQQVGATGMEVLMCWECNTGAVKHAGEDRCASRHVLLDNTD